VRQAVIVRTDAGSEPAHGPPRRWLMRIGGGATWGAARLCTLLHAVCGRRITFVHPLSAHPSRLTPVCGPGACRVCSTLLWYTAGVPWEPGAHDGPAPSFACPCRRCVWYTATWVICAHTSHLAATRGTQYTPDRLRRHAVITRDVTERFPLLDPLEHGCPGRGRDLPARIRFGLRVAR
jgi:hypothetical protein